MLLSKSLEEAVPINNYKGHAIPRMLIEKPVFKVWALRGGIQQDRRHFDTHSSRYNELFSEHDVGTVLSLSYSDRCDAYFRGMYLTSKSWTLDPGNDFTINMEYQTAWSDYKKKYTGWATEKVASEKNIKEVEVDGKDVEKIIAKVFNGLKDKAKKDSYLMRDNIAHLRIFNKCFVERDDPHVYEQQSHFVNKQQLELGLMLSPFIYTSEERNLGKSVFHSCTDLQLKIYPWFKSFPLYQRHTGDIMNAPPNMKNFVKDNKVWAATQNHRSSEKGVKKPLHSAITNSRQCWITEFKNQLSGKGIVIPFSETLDLEHTHNLIQVLRALGNKYPIQIVHYGNLREEIKKKLIEGAQRPFTDFPSSFSRVAESLPKLSFHSQTQGFLKQELWFVDAAHMITEHFQSKLSNVPLRAWAALANSFDEYILMDPLTVPVQNPQYFFDLPEYKSKGAYFYRARPWIKRDISDGNFFNKMAPSLVDATMFGIPLLSKHTLDIPYFEGLAQVQDPRLAIIDRTRHFSSVMMYLQLAMYFPANHRTNNATEIWLGFALNGDNDFHFSGVMPAAVGKTTERALRLKSDKTPDSEEICSAQVGHVDLSDKLAWIASGFKTCPASNIDYGEELSTKVYPWRHVGGEDELKNYYASRIMLEQAIVPPFTNMSYLLLDNDEKEPSLPWSHHKACGEEFFCGYSRIGGKKGSSDTSLHGRIIEFDSSEVDLYNFYGDIWVGND